MTSAPFLIAMLFAFSCPLIPLLWRELGGPRTLREVLMSIPQIVGTAAAVIIILYWLAVILLTPFVEAARAGAWLISLI